MADQDLIQLEKKLIERQEKLDEAREDLEREKKQIADKKDEYIEKLQKVSGLTSEEAKKELLLQIEEKEAQILAKIIREREEEAKRTADKRAQEIVVESMRHGAVSYIPEYTVSIVRIPDEEIKGRIIGKEGRNIRAFEQATGVDVDLDEEGVIRLSSFDQVRREIARRSLEKLIKDTRVQPFRIEEIVEEINMLQVKSDVADDSTPDAPEIKIEE
jgi:ribonuclease Y